MSGEQSHKSELEIKEARAESKQDMLQHTLECEKRYGKIMARMEAHSAILSRNTKILVGLLLATVVVAIERAWFILN